MSYHPVRLRHGNTREGGSFRIEKSIFVALSVIVIAMLLTGAFGNVTMARDPLANSPVTAVKIDGDEELRESWLVSAGSGSVGDPFVIASHLVVGVTFGLWLNGTTNHVVIRKNEFINVATTEPIGGLIVSNAANITITENEFRSTTSYVLIEQSANVTVAENRFAPFGEPIDTVAVVAHDSRHIYVHNNTMDGQTIGVQFGQGVRDSVIRENVVKVTGGRLSHGISVYGKSANVSIQSNYLFGDRAASAILIFASSEISIQDNLVQNFGTGVHWGPSHGRFPGEVTRLTFISNTLLNNEKGLDAAVCTSCLVAHNNFQKNRIGISSVSDLSFDCNIIAHNDLGIDSAAPSSGRNNTIENNLA